MVMMGAFIQIDLAEISALIRNFWTNDLTSSCLIFHMCKWEEKKIHFNRVIVRIEYDNVWGWCLVWSVWVNGIYYFELRSDWLLIPEGNKFASKGLNKIHVSWSSTFSYFPSFLRLSSFPPICSLVMLCLLLILFPKPLLSLLILTWNQQ